LQVRVKKDLRKRQLTWMIFKQNLSQKELLSNTIHKRSRNLEEDTLQVLVTNLQVDQEVLATLIERGRTKKDKKS